VFVGCHREAVTLQGPGLNPPQDPHPVQVSLIRDATIVLAIGSSTQEAAAAWDSATPRAKDAEEWAPLAEREALGGLSRAKAENSMKLASTREDTERLARMVALLEDKLAAELKICLRGSTEHTSWSSPFCKP
jgi:hypothetical protein